jgi:hypothetical protein
MPAALASLRDPFPINQVNREGVKTLPLADQDMPNRR